MSVRHVARISSPDMDSAAFMRRTPIEQRREYFYLRRHMTAYQSSIWQRLAAWLNKPVRWNDWS
jgi:hypothetical protein